ncbi:DUF2970 domain-containing protein [Paraglaciecola hydrolytica]|uniref:DUF2970 domain-containing protein n=1 Tax=Paraglaciecola hydrolytica TaxID=1799789 RepID=A0A136A1U9_9ALTE|nr:DUF2970 domain-containing protein [Paraglaciecola hydrolytica]KXI29194.1 hypothetical protein AX660_13680 [Paraglaciecola hydrolytica]
MFKYSADKAKLFDVFKSVAASMFGVQSAKNRERDFQQSSIVPYIVVGVIFVLLLIIGLVAVVSIIV